jgi:hypothetical protein
MKKPSLESALATKTPPAPSTPPAAAQPAAPPAPPKLTDSRTATTLRIEPEKLEALKIIAARKRCRVNDLILEGVDYILALHVVK